MKFILTATDDMLADAFDKHCAGEDNISIHRGSIFDVECDAVVSPANSFGFMDGGIDAWYSWHFGDVVQDNVRMAILRHWHGELPVGCAEIVATENDKVPYLVAAPTMRVPSILGKESVNPYMAVRAVVMLVREAVFRDGAFAGEPIRDHVNTIALPGMGTGVGRVPFDIAAHQIKEAIIRHSTGRHYLPKSWFEASEDHQGLCLKKFKDMQQN